MVFANVSDIELIYLTRSNNYFAKDYLIERYRKRIYGIIAELTKKRIIKGLDYEDWFQDGFIVFLKCLDLFDIEYNFYNYLLSALKKEFSRKMKQIYENNKIISLDEPNEQGICLLDVIAEEDENYNNIQVQHDIDTKFTKLEQDIVKLKSRGYDCFEISKMIGVNKKVVYRKTKDIRNKMTEITMD